MELAEASKRLGTIVFCQRAGILEHGDDGQILIATSDLEAIEFAAAMLGVFVEAMEDTE